MALQEISIPDLTLWLFTRPPLDPCTYKIFDDDKPEKMFPVLMSLLIHGAKHMYGKDITPAKITSSQLTTLKLYFMSIGYQIKHSFLDKDDSKIVNIWFEKIRFSEDCKGNKIFR
jgi:hypothetical protein